MIQNSISQDFDVIVIGGSFAGLSAATQLGRARVHTLLLDSCSPRNRFTRHSHGFLGLDGKSPEEIRDIGRKQILRYPMVELVEGRAVRAKALTSAPLPFSFQVETEDGRLFNARRLILATGMKDTLPEIAGFMDIWGKSAFFCPYCDGFEFSDQAFVCLAAGEMSIHQVILLTAWSRNVTLLLNGSFTPTEEQAGQLQRKGIQIVEGRPVSVESQDGMLKGIALSDGSTLKADTLYVMPNASPATDLGEQLGCKMESHPISRYIWVDEQKMTSCPGVYAAGDVSRFLFNAGVAASDGLLAGTFAHQSLVFAD